MTTEETERLRDLLKKLSDHLTNQEYYAKNSEAVDCATYLIQFIDEDL
jgi:hypothetical protein